MNQIDQTIELSENDKLIMQMTAWNEFKSKFRECGDSEVDLMKALKHGLFYGINASIERQRSNGVPDGWQLVPIEPTEDMLREVDEDVGGHCYSCTKWRASDDDCRRVYAAMLSATPSAPIEAQQSVTQALEVLKDAQLAIAPSPDKCRKSREVNRWIYLQSVIDGLQALIPSTQAPKP